MGTYFESIVFTAFLAVCLCGCKEGQVRRWIVASQTRDCTGAGAQTCYLIRERESDPWQYFYGRIEGFDYHPGYQWTVDVRIRRVENPPADASSFSYELVRVVDKVQKESEGLPPVRQ